MEFLTTFHTGRRRSWAAGRSAGRAGIEGRRREQRASQRSRGAGAQRGGGGGGGRGAVCLWHLLGGGRA
eukprot:SAG25_NODE_554_length_6983_cov_2.661970_2_plen_69_part_00